MTHTLRTDIENLPMDGRHVIIGTMKGEVFLSRFIAPTSSSSKGRWPGLSPEDWPVAWLDVPTHPYFPDTTRPLLNGERAKQ